MTPNFCGAGDETISMLSPTENPIPNRQQAAWLPFVLAGVLGLSYALILPVWSGPDEMAHMAYIAALAQGHLPLVPSDRTADLLTGTTYQAQHPPLFYLLATPFYLVTGRDAVITLYVLRLLGVATFLGTLRLLQMWSRRLLSPQTSRVATWLFAIHPVTVYVASMMNNEMLAILFGVGCLSAIERASRQQAFAQQRKWLLLAIFCGALGLMTKLTALCAVVAAGVFWWHSDIDKRNEAQSKMQWKRGFVGMLIIGGSALPWWPWSWFLRHSRGDVLPAVFAPLFTGGPLALIGYPEVALRSAAMTLVELSAGFVVPTWVLHDRSYFSMYVIYGIGALCFLVLMLACWHRQFRFVAVGFFVLWSLVTLQVWFRDNFALITAARYIPAISAPAAVAIAAEFHKLSPRGQRVAMALWIPITLAMAALPFYSAFE